MKLSRLLSPLGFGFLSLLALPLFAGDESRTVRIDLNAEKDLVKLAVDATSDGARAANSEWRKEKADYWITAVFPSDSRWGESSITFTPATSGRVVIILKGPYIRGANSDSPLKLVWAYFDEIRATGAIVQNPGFEELQGEKPVAWYRQPTPNGVKLPPESLADLDPIQPDKGRFAARVWHHSSYSQAIQVEAGKPVTLTFRHRLYD